MVIVGIGCEHLSCLNDSFVIVMRIQSSFGSLESGLYN